MTKRNGKVSNLAGVAADLHSPGLHDDVTDARELRPDPEILEQRPKRRQFNARYKRHILEQTDRLADGQLGAFLRREGLYSSLLSTWRRQREEATVAGLEPRRKGRKSAPAASPEGRRVLELEKENVKLKKRVDQLLLVLDAQKKVLSLCELVAQDVKSSQS